jgi:hypothetical protein
VGSVRGLGGGGSPDEEVSLGGGGAAFAGNGFFLGHLVEGVAVLVDESSDVVLPDALLGQIDQPHAAERAEDFVLGIAADSESGGRDRISSGCGAFGHG